MNPISHTEPHLSPSNLPMEPPLDHGWDGSFSGPDIQVFARRKVPPHSADGHDSHADDDSALALHLEAASMAEETLLDDDVSEMCTSFVEQVFERPQATLAGRIVFGAVATACLLALLAMALFHIWAHGQATRLGFTYSQVSKQHTRLKEERRLLKLQLAKLRNPMRLARIARQQLGMRLPHRSQVISEEQVASQLRAHRAGARSRKGIRLASNRRTHMIR